MGKARAFSNEGEDANYLRESEDETYKVTQQNSYNLGSTTFSDQSGIGNFSQSGTDQTKANLTGALFRGNIGFLLQSAVLDDTTNTINLLFDQNDVAVSDVSSDVIVIISGVATTADLEIILGAQRPGQRLVVYNTDGNTITIKDASTAASPTDPNLIHTPGALDYIITGFDSVQLVFDSIEEQWRIVGAVGTGGGTGYNLIQDEGISLTQRTTMNFIGNSVTAVDNPGQSRTDITINTPSGTIPDGTAENQHLEWDNSFLTWNAVDALTFGTTGPFAASGFLRTANDEIIFASRNAGDSDDIRLKINSSDRFIFEFPGSVVPLEVAVDLIDVKTVDIVNIDRAKFVQSSGSMVPSNTTGILKNSNAQFQFNSESPNAFLFTFDTDTALTLTPSSLTLENTSTNPFFTFFRDENGVTDNLIGNLVYKSKTASGGEFTYSNISSTISDATLGQEDSIIFLSTTNNGLFGNARLIINADSSQILRFESIAPDTNVVTPVFELLSTSQVTPTGLRNIADIDFTATTNDGGGVGVAETFAKIIVDQEDPDITNESGSMRFRLRDQTGTAGAIKTYLQFNDSSNGIIEALKDITLENFTLNPVLTFFRNQTGATDNPLGNIVFRGQQSNNNPFTYSTISSVISDATLGQEDSIITLSTTNDGLLANVQLVVNADSSQILRFDSTSPSSTFASPILELLAAVGSAPPTGAVQRIGEINFEATTNDGGGIGAVEPFAQIIVDQEESDITNESAGMRFRLRDQTGTAGAIKTYLQFNDGSNESIQALKNIIPFGTTIDLGDDDNRFQDIYLQEAFNASKIIFGTTTDNDTYITGSGSTGRINVFADGSNSIAFDPVGITLFADRYLTMDERLTDPTPLVNAGIFYVKDIGGNAEPWFVGDGTAAQSLLGGGVSNQIVDGNAKAIVQAETFQVFTNSVERFNINPSGTLSLLGDTNILGDLDMNTNFIRFDGIAVPSTTLGEPKLFANSSNSDHLSIKSGDGSTIDLETGGGVSNQIVDGNAKAIVNFETFQVFTNSVERFNINPIGQISLLGPVATIGDIDMNSRKIFDLKTLEYETLENITLDNAKVLITSELQQPLGNTGSEMIFNIPNTDPAPDVFNDFYKFYTGTFPNNPVLTVGRREFRYTSLNALNIPGGASFNVSTNNINLSVFGSPETEGVNIGVLGSSLVPKAIFPFVPATPFLNLGKSSSTSDDSQFWKHLFVKFIQFTPGSPGDGLINIHQEGKHLLLETAPLTGNRADIRFNRTQIGGGFGIEFAKFTDDGDVFTPRNQFVVADTTDCIFNADVTLGNAIADDISIVGRVDTDILPKNDSANRLGSGAQRWEFVHATSGVFNTVNASLVLTLDSGTFFLLDECNMNIDTTIGTKIGTGTNQKIGFWNSTPVVQQTVASDTLANLYTALRNNGIIG